MKTNNDAELKQNKTAEETADDQKAPGSENKDGNSDGQADDLKKTEKPEEKVVDYKAELEKEKADSKNYRDGMLAAKDKIKKMEADDKRSQHQPTEASQELMREEAASLVKAELDNFKSGLVEDKITEVISVLSTNLDERTLIRFHYDNTIRHSGFSIQDIQRDLKKCKLLANEGRVQKNLDEIKKAQHSGDSQSKGTPASSDAPGGDQPDGTMQLSAADQAVLARRGLTAKDVKN